MSVDYSVQNELHTGIGGSFLDATDGKDDIMALATPTLVLHWKLPRKAEWFHVEMLAQGGLLSSALSERDPNSVAELIFPFRIDARYRLKVPRKRIRQSGRTEETRSRDGIGHRE